MLRYEPEDLVELLKINLIAKEQLKSIILLRHNAALEAKIATLENPELASNGHNNVTTFDVEQTEEARI
jgi:hypothetical protein